MPMAAAQCAQEREIVLSAMDRAWRMMKMAERTGIEWTDHTFNPWIGCQAVSDACDHCYAETLVKRWGGDFATRRRTAPANWKQPLKWNREAEKAGVQRRVFCSSLADVFDNQVPNEWRVDLWELIDATPWLIWQLLTKRPQNINKMTPQFVVPAWDEGARDWVDTPAMRSNVWLGTTVENQAEADRRVPHLLAVPAVVHFLSCEPLLSEIDIRWAISRNRLDIGAGFQRRGHFSPGLETLRPLDWVIGGGESGPHARPPMIEWARSLRDQCTTAGVAFFWKQWGEYAPDDPSATHTAMVRVGKKAAGSLLDGREWREFPV